MIVLSVGQVSGLIAVGVFVCKSPSDLGDEFSDTDTCLPVQTVLALSLPLILVAFLTEENTLVTW